MTASLDTTPTPQARAGEVRPIDTPTRLLAVILAATIVESFVHYTDNTLRYHDYMSDDPSVLASLIKRWVIPVAWVLFTVAAVAGYRYFRQGRWTRAAAVLGVYSVSGLISILHYTDIPMSQLSAFQNTFVIGDFVLGVSVAAFAIWTARRPSTP